MQEFGWNAPSVLSCSPQLITWDIEFQQTDCRQPMKRWGLYLRLQDPLNVTQLLSFLGVVNYYSKFLPNLSTMLAPLYRLFKNKQSGFGMLNRIKHFMKPRLTECLLIHYDAQKELVQSCDASPYGVGTVLSQTTRWFRATCSICK